MKSSVLLSSLMALSALVACAPVASAPTPGPSAEVPSECRADAYRSYVGRDRSELPTKPANENWRVVCSTCAVTMDYRADRLNIVYDTASNRITEVKCG